MSDVTRILSQIEQGDPQAAEKLLPLVYDDLRKLAKANKLLVPASTNKRRSVTKNTVIKPSAIDFRQNYERRPPNTHLKEQSALAATSSLRKMLHVLCARLLWARSGSIRDCRFLLAPSRTTI